jgi:LIM-domain binding protein
MAQPYPAGMPPGHPGMGGHGHPMAGMQHPGSVHMGGPAGPAMMQGMHPGVSGPQVTQSPMVTGMPQGPGTPAPGPMHNGSMAMAHLGPQQHMFQQQNPQLAFNQVNMNQQQQAYLRQQMTAARMQQQQGQVGMPMGMPNQPNFNQAQLAAAAQMKMAGMPMQQQQMHPSQAQTYQLVAQQRMMQAHAQQAHAQAQAMAAQNQARQAQQMQQSRSQEPQLSQPPQNHPTPAPQGQPQPQSQSQPQAQPTPQPQSQPAPQKPAPVQQPATSQPPNPAATQQVKQIESDEEAPVKQQDPGALMMQIQDIPKEQILIGHSILQLIMFQDSLASPEQPNDLSYWEALIRKYFSVFGCLKQQYFNSRNQSDKSFQLLFPSLARFFLTHFSTGIKQILLQSYDHTQSRTANGNTCVKSESASLTYVFHNDIRVTTQGQLFVVFDESNKILRFDLSTHQWQEYIPKSILLNPPSPDQKQSPKMNKNLKKVQGQGKPSSPGLNIPSSGIGDYGVPPRIVSFLEVGSNPDIIINTANKFRGNGNYYPDAATHGILSYSC